MKEVWMPIKDYEGMYEVSNLGRVKSLYRIVNLIRQGHEQIIIVEERILKPRPNGRGYITVGLSKGKGRNFQVHRLVAIAFIDNLDDLRCVNHKNGIKTDNRTINLEWCTHKENTIHAFKTGLIKVSEDVLRGLYEGRIKAIFDSEMGIYYESMRFAHEALGGSRHMFYRRIKLGKQSRFILL